MTIMILPLQLYVYGIVACRPTVYNEWYLRLGYVYFFTHWDDYGVHAVVNKVSP